MAEAAENETKKSLERIEIPEEVQKSLDKLENNLTLSSQLSTDQLIVKSPQESPDASVNSLNQEVRKNDSKGCFDVVMCTGLLQVLFGGLMVAFGVLVIKYEANLSQVNFFFSI